MVCMCMLNLSLLSAASCLLSYIVIVLYRASALVVDRWLLGVGSTSYICVPVHLGKNYRFHALVHLSSRVHM